MVPNAQFKDKKLNLQRLLDYGFVPRDGGYIYSSRLLDGQFELKVAISADEKVATKVIDSASGEEYVLHRIAGSTGAFVGRIKEEYETVLQSISEQCFDRDVFKSEYARLVIQYVRETYQRELEYLWERFPNNAIWRRSDNEKWFGGLLTIPKSKLGLGGKEIIEIIDLRLEPEKMESVVDGVRYFPGYHMNKKHWFTICLDGSVSIEDIYSWIDGSYEIAAKK